MQLEIRIHDATPKTAISWRQEYHILCVAPYSSNTEHVVHSLQKMEVDFYDPIVQCQAFTDLKFQVRRKSYKIEHMTATVQLK